MPRCLAPRHGRGRRHYAGAMARSWAELLGEPDAAPEAEEQGGRFFSRLRDSLSKSRRALTGELAAATSLDPRGDADWERLAGGPLARGVGGPATPPLGLRLREP